jgi:transposase-like protein
MTYRRYDKEFIKEIVESIEKGTLRSAITREHGIARSVLACWMRDYGLQRTILVSKAILVSRKKGPSSGP